MENGTSSVVGQFSFAFDDHAGNGIVGFLLG